MAETSSLVVDSSVVAKWYLEEPGSKHAMALRDEFATGKLELSVPTLLFYEVMNALRFSGAFGGEELAVASRSLSEYRFQAWRPRGKLLEIATRLSVDEDVTLYDASYVALAKIKGTRVVTEDREILEKFPSLAKPLEDFVT